MSPGHARAKKDDWQVKKYIIVTALNADDDKTHKTRLLSFQTFLKLAIWRLSHRDGLQYQIKILAMHGYTWWDTTVSKPKCTGYMRARRQ
jgi:hypothetical protein